MNPAPPTMNQRITSGCSRGLVCSTGRLPLRRVGLEAGWLTRRCHTTAARPSVWGVMRSSTSGGMTTQAVGDLRGVATVAADDPEDRGAAFAARARERSRCWRTRSVRGRRRRRRTPGCRRRPDPRPLSHSENTVSQPSSLVRAVSSDTLSVGAYASKPQSFRKSLTAWPACPAEPPTPRMNSRPPRSRTAARP